MKLHIGHYILFIFLFAVGAYGAYTLYPFFFEKAATSEATIILDETAQLEQLGYTHAPGDLPLSVQLERFQDMLESDQYHFGSGRALGETKIAARKHALEEATIDLGKKSPSSPIQNVVSCFKTQSNGVEYFIVIAVKK